MNEAGFRKAGFESVYTHIESLRVQMLKQTDEHHIVTFVLLKT